jgi:hypothetical protein
VQLSPARDETGITAVGGANLHEVGACAAVSNSWLLFPLFFLFSSATRVRLSAVKAKQRDLQQQTRQQAKSRPQKPVAATRKRSCPDPELPAGKHVAGLTCASSTSVRGSRACSSSSNSNGGSSSSTSSSSSSSSSSNSSSTFSISGSGLFALRVDEALQSVRAAEEKEVADVSAAEPWYLQVMATTQCASQDLWKLIKAGTDMEHWTTCAWQVLIAIVQASRAGVANQHLHPAVEGLLHTLEHVADVCAGDSSLFLTLGGRCMLRLPALLLLCLEHWSSRPLCDVVGGARDDRDWLQCLEAQDSACGELSTDSTGSQAGRGRHRDSVRDAAQVDTAVSCWASLCTMVGLECVRGNEEDPPSLTDQQQEDWQLMIRTCRFSASAQEG